MVAGPSEIVVVADGKNDSDWIAADLLSQSEHDPTSQSILFTDDAAFAKAVAEAVDLQIGALATAKIRSEEHTSELQSLMRNSHAAFCFETKHQNHKHTKQHAYAPN